MGPLHGVRGRASPARSQRVVRKYDTTPPGQLAVGNTRGVDNNIKETL